MPDLDDADRADAPVASAAGSATSRRDLLRTGAVAGAAALGAAALARAAASAGASSRAASSVRALDAGTENAAGTEPIVVHVRDARSGEIDVFRGTSELRVKDPDLAARIVRASR